MSYYSDKWRRKSTNNENEIKNENNNNETVQVMVNRDSDRDRNRNKDRVNVNTNVLVFVIAITFSLLSIAGRLHTVESFSLPLGHHHIHHHIHHRLLSLPSYSTSSLSSLSSLTRKSYNFNRFQYKDRRIRKRMELLILASSSSPTSSPTSASTSASTSNDDEQQLIQEPLLDDSSLLSSSLSSENTNKNNENNKNDNGDNDNSDNDTSIQAILLLNLVAVIWGTQHSFIKLVVEDCDPSIFSLTRFALAAFIASLGPLLFGNKNEDMKKDMNGDTKKDINEERGTNKDTNIHIDTSNMDVSDSNSASISISDNNSASTSTNVSISNNNDEEDNATIWRWGVEMGFWMFLGYAFQAIGLEYTTAQRSGFLLYLNIKLVPLFAYLLYQRKISIPTWISAFTALAGTALLSFDGTSYEFNIGDVWSIAAAAASAMFILRLEFATKAVSNSSKLNSYSLWVVSFAALVWCLGDEMLSNIHIMNSMTTDTNTDAAIATSIGAVGAVGGSMNAFDVLVSTIESTWNKVVETLSLHPLEVIYLGGVTTALANYIQTKAQRGISAERASIIYALDPVYGAFFANVILGEELTVYGIGGAALITIAAATNAFLDLTDKSNEIN